MATLTKPKIIGKTDNQDLIIQVSEADRLGVYSLYFGDEDPILSARDDAKDSFVIHESVDDLFADLES